MKGKKTKALAIAAAICVCMFMFVGGAAFAIWFSQNFAIVPKAQFVDSLNEALSNSETLKGLTGEDGAISEEQLNKLLSQESIDKLMKGDQDVGQLLDELLKKEGGTAGATPPSEENKDWVMNSDLRDANKNGAFKFKFTPGENLKYHMTANVEGQGMEILGPGDIDMNMDSAFSLETLSVDREGFGKLRMKFGDTKVKGDFMGGGFYLSRGAEGTKLEMNGMTYIDEAANKGSTSGIPQLEFFDQPVDMEVAPNGVVTAISGESGMGAIMSGIPSFTDIEFPDEELTEGASWVSHVNMPVPGIGTPIPTTIVNTFTGYKTIGNRLCAVIDQQLTSEQTQGTITAPGGVFGEAMGFAMPEFKLGGANKVYFDVENGQMVHTDVDLDLGIDIGKTLGGGDDELGGLMDSLGDIIGQVPELDGLLPQTKGGSSKNGSSKKSDNLLEMNVDIKAQISLTDPPMPVN